MRLVVRLIDNDRESGGLTLKAFGDGFKYERGHFALNEESISKYPGAISVIAPILGTSVSILTKEQVIITCSGKYLPLSNYLPIKNYLPRASVWKFLQQIAKMADEITPNSYAVLCTGRQFLGCLGAKEKFEIASAYRVYLSEKRIECIIRNGELV